MMRPDVFLDAREFCVLLAELAGSVKGQDYEPVYRELGWVEPLRVKIQEVLSRGERVILCPDHIWPTGKVPPASTIKRRGAR